jgi:hypothetical protein
MIKVAVIQGQNLFDVALQEYGSADHIFQIITDNPELTLNSNVGAGSVLNIDETFIGEEDVKAYFQSQVKAKKFPVNYSDAETGDYNTDYNNDFNI